VGYLVKKAQEKPGLFEGAKITASSYQETKTVKANIIIDPNSLTELQVRTKSGEVVERTFGYLPENVADGSNGTRWQADTGDKEPWLMIDFGRKINISQCEIAFAFPTFGHAWELQKSNDGEKWESCKKVEEIEVCSPHISKDIGKARFLKVIVLKGSPGIWELRVF
jgi:hypothetical protein